MTIFVHSFVIITNSVLAVCNGIYTLYMYLTNHSTFVETGLNMLETSDFTTYS